MDLSRAMSLVELWRKEWPAEPDKQTPQQQALLTMYKELTADRLLELHARVQEAEVKADKALRTLARLRDVLNTSGG